ncbi:DUF5677 domain-containing protein, partial [Gottfriedia acidiceleris]|uniref:DUF5677 domain-containing protein n=1 Tax=Gottfriedia acidiceleris TaxID=371036 RepID=UPI002FFE96E3
MHNLNLIIKESEDITESILKNCFEGKEREIDREDIAIFGLFESMLEKAKSLLLLLESEDYSSSEIITRVIFEHSIY